MDRLEAMGMLITVSQTGSLTAASKVLRVPLATLSRKVADLEALLGARLLTRTTRRVSLTEAGVGYVAAARRILEQVEEAEREAVGEFTAPKGELVVTAPLMFGRVHLLPVVCDFLAAFPEIRVRLSLSDRHVDLVGDQVDMALRIGHLPDSSMVATAVGTLRTVTCASPAFLAQHRRPAAPGDLLALPCVSVDGPMPSAAWRYRDPSSGEATGLPVSARLRVTTPEAAAAAAVLGAGVTQVLHYQVADALRQRKLELLLEAHEPAPIPVQLVHPTRGQMPQKLRRFLDFAAPRLRQDLAALLSPAKRHGS